MNKRTVDETFSQINGVMQQLAKKHFENADKFLQMPLRLQLPAMKSWGASQMHWELVILIDEIENVLKQLPTMD